MGNRAGFVIVGAEGHERRSSPARLVAALPNATVGHGFAPAVTGPQAIAARAAVERAYAAAVGT
ncbi:hypothetical protein ACWGAN_08710 [Streptomyces sp. NPDC054945]